MVKYWFAEKCSESCFLLFDLWALVRTELYRALTALTDAYFSLHGNYRTDIRPAGKITFFLLSFMINLVHFNWPAGLAWCAWTDSSGNIRSWTSWVPPHPGSLLDRRGQWGGGGGGGWCWSWSCCHRESLWLITVLMYSASLAHWSVSSVLTARPSQHD